MKINLIPEIKETEQKIKRTNIVGTAVCILIIAGFVVFLIILSGINLAARASKKNLENRMKETNRRLENYRDLEKTVVSLENSLNGIEDLLNNISKWSVFYKELEKAIPNDVQITTLEFKGSEMELKLKGQSVNSVARFIKSFKEYKYKKGDDFESKNLFSSVDISKYSKDESGIVFNATVNFNEEILW